MIATPILVLIVSRLLSKEELSWQKTAGIIMGATGALLLIVSGKKIAEGVNTPLGDTFIFINAASYAAYLVIVKPLMMKYNPLTVISWVFLFGFIFVLPVGYNQFSDIQWHTFTPAVWWAVVSVVIGATFLAYLFNIIALKHSSPAVAGIYIYLQPIIATLVAVWFGKDELSWPKILSAVLIFTGVYLVSFSKQKALAKKEI
jgi:drug/metabolite transporter (DMT)-like permease